MHVDRTLRLFLLLPPACLEHVHGTAPVLAEARQTGAPSATPEIRRASYVMTTDEKRRGAQTPLGRPSLGADFGRYRDQTPGRMILKVTGLG